MAPGDEKGGVSIKHVYQGKCLLPFSYMFTYLQIHILHACIYSLLSAQTSLVNWKSCFTHVRYLVMYHCWVLGKQKILQATMCKTNLLSLKGEGKYNNFFIYTYKVIQNRIFCHPVLKKKVELLYTFEVKEITIYRRVTPRRTLLYLKPKILISLTSHHLFQFEFTYTMQYYQCSFGVTSNCVNNSLKLQRA